MFANVYFDGIYQNLKNCLMYFFMLDTTVSKIQTLHMFNLEKKEVIVMVTLIMVPSDDNYQYLLKKFPLLRYLSDISI